MFANPALASRKNAEAEIADAALQKKRGRGFVAHSGYLNQSWLERWAQ